MRFVIAMIGILASLPTLIFSWVGTQTFGNPSERALAVGVTILSGTLLLLSATLLFAPSVQRLQVIVLIATIVIVGMILTVF